MRLKHHCASPDDASYSLGNSFARKNNHSGFKCAGWHRNVLYDRKLVFVIQQVAYSINRGDGRGVSSSTFFVYRCRVVEL